MSQKTMPVKGVYQCVAGRNGVSSLGSPYLKSDKLTKITLVTGGKLVLTMNDIVGGSYHGLAQCGHFLGGWSDNKDCRGHGGPDTKLRDGYKRGRRYFTVK